MDRKFKHHRVTFDVVLIVDCHLSKAAERRLYALMDAHREGAISAAVLVLRHGWQASSWLRSDAAQRRLTEGRFVWLDPGMPCRTRLALILSPGLAAFGRNRALRLMADQAIIWPIEADFGAAARDPAAFRDQWERVRTILGTPLTWAARSEAERHCLAQRSAGVPLEPDIWWPLFTHAPRPDDEQPAQCRRTVGRHWRPGARLDEVALAEWLDASRDAWPMPLALYGTPDLLQGLPPAPADQTIRHHDQSQYRLDRFLADLDLFVALGVDREPTCLQEEILEAIAAGLLVIATAATSALFDDSLPSAEPCFLGELAEALLADDQAFRQARQRQAELFIRRHGGDAYRHRLASRLGAAKRTPSLVWSSRTRRPGRVLFVSDDSPYLEHLPRQLAIAQHLQAPLEPYFLTLARDAALAEQMGFPVEYLLAHSSRTYRALFDRTEAWNHALARHVQELIAFLDAKAVVFDGVYPFAGLAEICSRQPNLPFAWIRRGLWRADAEPGGLARNGLFDLIIEPGERAGSFDRGPTRSLRDHVVATGPIRLGKLQARARARYELGVEANQPAVFLQPTVPGNQRTGEALGELLRGLADGGCRFWTTDLIPGQASPEWPIDAAWLDSLAARRRLRGFDMVIGGADYRTVHDCAAAGTPSVFLPDCTRPTDDQVTRAALAARAGWAVVLAQGDVYGARNAARRLLDPEARAAMAGLIGEERDDEGAEQAAQAIGQMVYALDLTPPPSWRRTPGAP